MKKSGIVLLASIFSWIIGLAQTDGPYVSYSDQYVYVHSIKQQNGMSGVVTDSFPIAQKSTIELTIGTDRPGQTFTVRLKNQLNNESPETVLAGKLFVVSDIEGNFAAFRTILQNNGIIDTALNWTFGNGQVVLTGDFVDRGDMVPEVLWFIYSLEEKAKAAGGYVHFVLGNHEIMNLSGDVRYIHKKYAFTTTLMGVKYECLYDKHTELGRWLRTKNIMEKVGDDIFVHAGISEEINTLGLSLSRINEMARPYYEDSTFKFPNKKLPVIFSNQGPFWYRGYYQKDANDVLADQVQRSLSKFKAKHIFTGHTIMGDTISVWFGGKVINTDVHHAEGKSEAVLLENGVYYRVTSKGERFKLL